MDFNRWGDIKCFESTRVVLPEPRDYIHANYVDGYRHPKKFICTQGPLKQTINDFWRMIWQEKTVVIIALTKVGGSKCELYLPEEQGTAMQYGGIKVQVQYALSPSQQYQMLFRIRKSMTSVTLTAKQFSEYLKEKRFTTPEEKTYGRFLDLFFSETTSCAFTLPRMAGQRNSRLLHGISGVYGQVQQLGEYVHCQTRSGKAMDIPRPRTSGILLPYGSFHMKSTNYVMENLKRMHDSIKPAVWSRHFVTKPNAD